MKKILQFEINNCLNSTEYKMMLGIMATFSLGGYLITVINFWGSPLIFLRSGYELCMVGESPYTSLIYSTITIILPFFVSFIHVFSRKNEETKNMVQTIIVRTSYPLYLAAKKITIFFMTVITITVPLLINFFLSLLTYGRISYDNNYSYPPYDLFVQNGDASIWLDFMRIQNPLVYVILKILIVSIIAGVFAVFLYSLQSIKYLVEKNRYFITAVVFVVYLISFIFTEFFGFSQLSYINYMEPYGPGNMENLFLMVIIPLIASFVLDFFSVETQERRKYIKSEQKYKIYD